MQYVDKFRLDDVKEVANLHSKVFYPEGEVPSEGLFKYYRTVFFDNPWSCDDVSSFVYRSKGKVVGFIGIIPRPMSYMGREIRVAVAHRIMVDPDSKTPLTAIKLVRKFLGGCQDLSLADGANHAGRKLLEGAGASVSYLYSMNWFRPLRPFSYGMTLLAKKGKLRPLSVLLRPMSALADSVAKSALGDLLRPLPPENVSSAELSQELLLDCIQEFAKVNSLYPIYDAKSMEWIWNFLRCNQDRGELNGSVLYDKKNRKIGVYLYCLRSNRIGEVMFLLAAKGWHNEVVSYLLNHAWEKRVICLFGRLESKFLSALWDHHALIKRGCWGLFHARDENLLNVIHRGDAFISALDGELLFRSPMDRL